MNNYPRCVDKRNMRKNHLVVGAVTVLLSCTMSAGNSTQSAVKAVSSANKKQSNVQADRVVPPEVVQCKNVRTSDGIKFITVTGKTDQYHLSCNLKAAGCITPESGKNYLLFNKTTRWKLPGAKDFMTLTWVQDWTVSYNQVENIALVAEDDSSEKLGMFRLDSPSGDSDRGTTKQETFESLSAFRDAIGYNVLRKDQLVRRDLDAPDLTLSTIRNVHIFSVDKRLDFKGVVVMTYETLASGKVLFGVVNTPEDMIDHKIYSQLKHDDIVDIIGFAYCLSKIFRKLCNDCG
jgi:hypothetical protein